MKRSEINQAIQDMIELAGEMRFAFPPFAHFSADAWKDCGTEYDEVRHAGLGWDVTDFGKGDFARCGLTLFTVRNGVHNDAKSKPYCEKIMRAGEGQVTPMHFHWKKIEDIINRGGGNLIVEVQCADKSEALCDDEVVVSLDGCVKRVAPGTQLTLAPGESITLTPYVYHAFWGEPGKGAVLVGEVSTVNDDANDNRFLDELPRYPGIEEDESPKRLLCTEVPSAA